MVTSSHRITTTSCALTAFVLISILLITSSSRAADKKNSVCISEFDKCRYACVKAINPDQCYDTCIGVRDQCIRGRQ